MQSRSSLRRRWVIGLALGALMLGVPAEECRAQQAKKEAVKEAVKEAKKVESATEPVPRDGNWVKMHEAFLERAKKGDVDLLFLGDSITQGWHDNAVWKRHYGPRRAANFGIGGDRTQHVLWRIENGELDGITPKVVVLMIGTNNVGSNSAEEIADGIKAIVKKLREKLPDAKILLLGVFPRGEKPNRGREKLQEVNAKVAPLDDGEHVFYLDIGPKFLNEDGSIPKDLMPDFLHLSRQGYHVWADAIEPTLWRLLDEKKPDEKK